SLAWDVSAAGPLTYRVFRDGVEVTETPNDTYTDSAGLMPDTAYVYTVRSSQNEDSESPSSSPLVVRTLSPGSTSTAPGGSEGGGGTNPLTSPRSLHSTNISQTSVSLAWSAPSSLGSGGLIYTIRQNGNTIGTTSKLAFTVDALAPA